MKILVTGGAGFIGSHVVDGCLAAGHEVVVVDNLSTGRRQLVGVGARLSVLDVRSSRLADLFDTERPEAVIHLAAQSEVRRSVEDPILDAELNILGSLNVLQCCRRFDVGRVIYASSGGAAYGDAASIPTREDHPTRPASPYGVSKLTVEHYLGCWTELNGLALRYANVYGPRQNPVGEAGVVAIFSHRLLMNQPVAMNGDGRQTRDYVYVRDIVDANMAALARPSVTGVLNIGTGVETSVVELLDRLCRAAGRRAQVVHRPPRAGEQRRSVLDSREARRRLQWSPRVALDEGLRRTVDHLASEIAGAPGQSTRPRGSG